jgi:predicted DNA-binding protein (UPF0251 family)
MYYRHKNCPRRNFFTMTNDPLKPQVFNAEEWISKSEAARLRGISRQAIWELVRRGRLTTVLFERRIYVYRSEVMDFTRRPRGPAVEKTGNLKKKNFDTSKWISPVEAGEVMGVTRQVISDLIRRRRLRTLISAGKTYVQRAAVEKFMAGRPTKKK